MAQHSDDVELLKRQFFQHVNPDDLTLPSKDLLRRPEIQAQIHECMFRTEGVLFPPPDGYQSRVLKLLMKEIEQSIVDPDEDEISDDLTSCLAGILAQPISLGAEYAQRKSYVTYSSPESLSVPADTITTLESPALLAAAGTTGLRTWEAAKFLVRFLYTPQGKSHVYRKRLIELGAGTGLVSMFCARYLGAEHTLVTDGAGEVIDCMVENMYLNQLDDRKRMSTAVLQWGHAVRPELVMDKDEISDYDLVLGADIIFDDRLILPLISTLQELFERFHGMKGLIAATVRNTTTLDGFLRSCESRNLIVKVLSSSLPIMDQSQTGLFYPPEPEIKIFEITRAAVVPDRSNSC